MVRNLLSRAVAAFKRWQIKTGARCICGSTATEPWSVKYNYCLDCGRRAA
jgi:hypothetical protein